MASYKKQKTSGQHGHTLGCESELSVLKMTDKEIKEKFCAIHTHADIDINVASLFAVVKNILSPAIVAVENIVLGTNKEYVGESSPEASLKPPLCILKELSNEMACKDPGEKIAQETAVSILEKLKDYKWDAKAVLTLAAFALDYGEFWHLAQFHSSLDQLTKSLGILKRVPVVLPHPGFEKYKQAILLLNNLIRDTLYVIECILQLEELLAKHDFKDESTLSTATDSISVDVFWAIISVVDCMSWMCCLTKDEDETQEISPFAVKITSILNSLKGQILRCNEIIAESEAYLKLKRFLESPGDIVEVFMKLIFSEDITYLIELRNNLSKDKVEKLKGKDVLLFFSDLDISKENVLILNPIYEKISREDQYKIVWIPIVEEWSDEMKDKFETLVSNCEMKWYVVQHFSSKLGIKYIEKEWQFMKRPKIVVLNSQGIVKHQDAFHMIKTWKIDAFPFTIEKETELQRRKEWFVSDIVNFIGDDTDIRKSINEGKYIFFYGGTDEWITQFLEKAQKMKDDSVITTSGARISIGLFAVGKDGNGKDDLDIFWKNINNLFFSNLQEDTELDKKKKEIQKLLSYKKDDNGWFVLCQGSRLVFSGYGTTVVKVLKNFDQWCQALQTSTEFEVILEQKYKEIEKTESHCWDFTIETNAGWVPVSLKCPEPDCFKIMEMYVRYKCCHEGHTANGLLP